MRNDSAHRPEGCEQFSTFHPRFLYESLWNLALAAGLVWLGRRWHRPPGRLFAAYVAGYRLGRLWVDAPRIDPANTIAGLRINIWMSLAAIAAGTVAMLWPTRPGRGGRAGRQAPLEMSVHGS